MSETLTEIYTRLAREGRLESDSAQLAVLPELQRIRDALETAPTRKRLGGLFAKAPPPPKGLYIWGGVGRGKSMLMDLFFSSVAIEAKRRVHFHAFMQEVQEALHKARQTGVDDAIKPVADQMSAHLKLLCFDEMQITDIADAMIVGRLFEQMMEHGVVIVSTSNRVPDDLYKDGLNRPLFEPFIDLLKDRLHVVELVSPRDYRQDRLEGATVYFSPLDPEARTNMRTLWDTMTEGADVHAHDIAVKGRTITLPRFASGVAWASFFDLCGQPLGPADYLAIADAVRVLFIADVPRLSSENYNAARRFVTLIDALYEARVRVVISAADTPERLYIEGAGAFEFERTASRLREMQAADWGQEEAFG